MPDDDNEIDESDFKEVSLSDLSIEELKELAREKGIKGTSKMSKEELEQKINEKDA